MLDMGIRENLTVAQLARRAAGTRGHWTVLGDGSETDTADALKKSGSSRARSTASTSWLPLLPQGMDRFIETVIPELRRRSLFRTEYEVRPCASLGLPWPDVARPLAAGGRVRGAAPRRVHHFRASLERVSMALEEARPAHHDRCYSPFFLARRSLNRRRRSITIIPAWSAAADFLFAIACRHLESRRVSLDATTTSAVARTSCRSRRGGDVAGAYRPLVPTALSPASRNALMALSAHSP